MLDISSSVSVPKRGFVALIPVTERRQRYHDRLDKVSVPKRGFVALIPVGGPHDLTAGCRFQSPSGDSWL